jgi:hypothetical protein
MPGATPVNPKVDAFMRRCVPALSPKALRRQVFQQLTAAAAGPPAGRFQAF